MSTASLSNLVIPSGAAVSNALDLSRVDSICIYAPDTLDALTFTIEVAPSRTSPAADWATLEEGGSDVALTAAKALVIPVAPFRSVRIASSGNVAADRTFHITGHES